MPLCQSKRGKSLSKLRLEREFYKEVQSNIKDFAQYAIDDIQGKWAELKFSDIKDDYRKIGKLNLSNSELESLRNIIKDAIIGAIHSTFVSIDGGTALSNEGKALELINFKTGKPLTNGALHENFMEVLD